MSATDDTRSGREQHLMLTNAAERELLSAVARLLAEREEMVGKVERMEAGLRIARQRIFKLWEENSLTSNVNIDAFEALRAIDSALEDALTRVRAHDGEGGR